MYTYIITAAASSFGPFLSHLAGRLAGPAVVAGNTDAQEACRSILVPHLVLASAYC